MTELKQLRISKNLTQQMAAERMGISLRSYVSYENDKDKTNSIKYRFMLKELESINPVDEEHGLLSIDEIKKVCQKVFVKYKVNYCILFGSYAKGKATETSDIDLLISTEVTGLKFFGLAEQLREELHKKVDLLDRRQLAHNEELLDDILKEGIRIYG